MLVVAVLRFQLVGLSFMPLCLHSAAWVAEVILAGGRLSSNTYGGLGFVEPLRVEPTSYSTQRSCSAPSAVTLGVFY